MKILNPNSSGQGYCPEHTDNPMHKVLCDLGWGYSHSVFVTYPINIKVMFHCYKLGDWNFSVQVWPSAWVTRFSCSKSGSGREHKMTWQRSSEVYLARKTKEILKSSPGSAAVSS